MFSVESHNAGFSISWDDDDLPLADALRTELMLEGMTRSQDWSNGIVVERYRNEFETLQLLLQLFERIAIVANVDPELERFLAAAGLEHTLYDTVSNGTQQPTPADRNVAEFAGRQLLDYQQHAVARHLLVQNTADFSVPGSGKTTVALASWVMARRAIPDLGLWVLGPLSCFRPWEDEFESCFGSAPNVVRVRGNRQERSQQLDSTNSHDLVLCSYHTAWREEPLIIDCLRRRPWMLVLDEAHYVKSMGGALSSAVRHLAPYARLRMILTGTPMPRSPEDLWSLFTFLWPSVQPIGSAEQFAIRCREDAPAAVCEDLRLQLSPFFHRTCKRDLGLPDIDHSDHAIPVDSIPAAQRLIIRLIENRTLEEADHLGPRDQAHLRRWRRARVIRLMQAVSNPELLADALADEEIRMIAEDELDANAPEDIETLNLEDRESDLAAALNRYRERTVVPAKATYVAQRCRELIEAGHKVVVWAHFNKNIDLLAELLEEYGPLCISGRIPAYDEDGDEETEDTRERRIELFKHDPSRPLLIASAAACAEAISLHRACQHAIYFERSFNAAHFIQSVDRIHRQGMPAGTTAHIEIPYIPCAIERVLNRRLRDRQTQLYRLLDDPMPVIGFDDETQTGFFDVEDFEDIDALFAEVLQEIRADRA